LTYVPVCASTCALILILSFVVSERKDKDIPVTGRGGP
jgi:hypothetical protein